MARGGAILAPRPQAAILRAPISRTFEEFTMGRGDRKTRKGKISIRSYGNARPHATKTTGATKTAGAKSPAKTAVKKAAPVKKAAAKRPA
jgi:ribosomal small subunit protein bTHX